MVELRRGPRGQVLATGVCHCGCEAETHGNALFLSGHDKVAESAVILIEYGGVAEFIARHGYGPGGKNARSELARWREQGGRPR